ncbi:hypothetical protein [Bacillus changyiensis]|uniref:hypothetical protein n=1 Tax=Bacillus changyiensis TaxID=3004103 RepID=UPI0022E3D561|nr:hypothetical protein [Bacillus changyiensis]MDA1478349.1 hypothetical protein [Bacillus changyiensis]
MRLVNKFNEYELYEFESKSELEEYVEVNQSILINTNCVDKKKFYAIKIKTLDSTIIGIFGGLHGIEPSARIDRMENCILINIDEKIYCVDLKDCGMKWVKEFDSVVYEVMKASDLTFLVICELGVVSLNYKGEKQWEHTSDVITDFELDSKTLKLSTYEGEYSLLLDNGNII